MCIYNNLYNNNLLGGIQRPPPPKFSPKLSRIPDPSHNPP